MKVAVFVKATPESEAGELPSEELLTAMGKYNEQLFEAGIMKAGEGLRPSSDGKRVLFSGTNRTVTDGPFAETKELVAGFWLWEVESMDEAVEWVKRCPNPMVSDSEIEIRPLFELSDFAEMDPEGEVAAQEDLLRIKTATANCSIQPYLFFSGRCQEALDFYQEALGAKVLFSMRFNESPDPTPEGMLQPGFEDKIMHASMQIGSMTINLSDGCDDQSKFQGFRLSLLMPTAADCDLVYNALANGGNADMPLTKTFWSERYGMVTDKSMSVGWLWSRPNNNKHIQRTFRMTRATIIKIVGWVLSFLVAAFLIFASAGGKFVDWEGKEEMFADLGWSTEAMFYVGILEVVVAVLFLLPRVGFIGALLVTAYLGGATATHVRVDDAFIFPIIFGVVVWVAMAMRQPTLLKVAFGFSPDCCSPKESVSEG